MNRWLESLRVRDVMCELIEGPSDRTAARLTLARDWRHRLGDSKQALGVAGAAPCEAPGSADAWDAVLALAAEPEAADLALEVYSCLAAVSADHPLEIRARSVERLASHLEAAGRQHHAEQAYHQLVDLGPPWAVPGLEALARIYEGREDWGPLLAVLRAELGMSPTSTRAIDLWTRVGVLLSEAMGQYGEAEQALKHATSIHPEHLAALQGLRHIYDISGRYEELYDLLDRMAGLETYAARRVALIKRQAAMALEHLDDPSRAIRNWFKVRSIAPDDPDVLEPLSTLLRNAERSEELAGVLADRLGHGGRSATERDELRRRLGHLYQHELESPERAEGVWMAVLEASDTPDVEALEAMSNLREAAGDYQGTNAYPRAALRSCRPGAPSRRAPALGVLMPGRRRQR